MKITYIHLLGIAIFFPFHSTISKCKFELRQLTPRVENMLLQIKTANADLMSEQQQRQKEVWYLVNVAVSITVIFTNMNRYTLVNLA